MDLSYDQSAIVSEEDINTESSKEENEEESDKKDSGVPPGATLGQTGLPEEMGFEPEINKELDSTETSQGQDIPDTLKHEDFSEAIKELDSSETNIEQERLRSEESNIQDVSGIIDEPNISGEIKEEPNIIETINEQDVSETIKGKDMFEEVKDRDIPLENKTQDTSGAIEGQDTVDAIKEKVMTEDIKEQDIFEVMKEQDSSEEIKDHTMSKAMSDIIKEQGISEEIKDHSISEAMSDIIKEQGISEEIKDHARSETINQENMSDVIKEQDISETNKESDISDSIKGQDMCEEGEGQNMFTSNQKQDVYGTDNEQDMSEAIKESDSSETIGQQDASEAIKQHDISEAIKQQDITDTIGQQDVSEAIKQQEIAEAITKQIISEAINQEIMSVSGNEQQMSEESNKQQNVTSETIIEQSFSGEIKEPDISDNINMSEAIKEQDFSERIEQHNTIEAIEKEDISETVKDEIILSEAMQKTYLSEAITGQDLCETDKGQDIPDTSKEEYMSEEILSSSKQKDYLESETMEDQAEDIKKERKKFLHKTSAEGTNLDSNEERKQNEPKSETISEGNIPNEEELELGFKEQKYEPVYQTFQEIISREVQELDSPQEEFEPMDHTFSEESSSTEGQRYDRKQLDDNKPVSQTFTEENVIDYEMKLDFKQEDSKNSEEKNLKTKEDLDLKQEENKPVLQKFSEEMDMYYKQRAEETDDKQQNIKETYQTFSEETLPGSDYKVQGDNPEYSTLEGNTSKKILESDPESKKDKSMDKESDLDEELDTNIRQNDNKEKLHREEIDLDFTQQNDELISQEFSPKESIPQKILEQHNKEGDGYPVYQTFGGASPKEEVDAKEIEPPETLEDKRVDKTFATQSGADEELKKDFKPKEDKKKFEIKSILKKGKSFGLEHSSDQMTHQPFTILDNDYDDDDDEDDDDEDDYEELEKRLDIQDNSPMSKNSAQETLLKDSGVDFPDQENKTSDGVPSNKGTSLYANKQENKPEMAEDILEGKVLALDSKKQNKTISGKEFVKVSLSDEDQEPDKTEEHETFLEKSISKEEPSLDKNHQKNKKKHPIFEGNIPKDYSMKDIKQMEDELETQTYSGGIMLEEEVDLHIKEDSVLPMIQKFDEETISAVECNLDFKQREGKTCGPAFTEELTLDKELQLETSLKDKFISGKNFQDVLPNEESLQGKEESIQSFPGNSVLKEQADVKKDINISVTAEIPVYEEMSIEKIESSTITGLSSNKILLDDKSSDYRLSSSLPSSMDDQTDTNNQITSPTSEKQVCIGDIIKNKRALCKEGLMDTSQIMPNIPDIRIEAAEKEIEDLTIHPIGILHQPKDTQRYTPIKESPYSSNSEEEEFPTEHNYPKEIPSDQMEILKASGIEKKEHLYKILVIGELGTGKTSIIKRYVHQFFSQHYRATIGVDFALKVISWDTDTLIRLQLWDIAGQERFGNMTRVYYKEAVGAFVVFDVTRVPTFEAVVKWKNDLDSKVQLSDGSNIPCVLLANKCDQTKEGLVNNSEQMDEFCKEKGFLNWFETSAKENINIDEAARFLVGQILKNDQNLNTGSAEDDPERIQLANANQDGGTKKSCCR